MAKQKLVASAELILDGADIFEATDKARSARTVLEQAQVEIQKTFPHFKFSFTVAQYRDPAAPKPGRRSAATVAAAGDPNAVKTNDAADTGAADTGAATVTAADPDPNPAPAPPPPPPPPAAVKPGKGEPAAAAA